MVMVAAENFWKPADKAITKPKGDSITIHPRTFNPVLLNRYLIMPELAKYQDVAAVIAKARNIHEKTFATKVRATVPD
jgi:hypothetical protein